jgi:hypothetical protein
VPLIEEWLPDFDVVERHDVALPVDPERALELALACPVAPDRVVAALLTARGMSPRGRTIEQFLRSNPFRELGRSSTEWAARLATRHMKVAIDFRAERIPGGSRLATETRVKAMDERARRAFRLYWLAVGPFSALIRRRWLKAIQAAARA